MPDRQTERGRTTENGPDRDVVRARRFLVRHPFTFASSDMGRWMSEFNAEEQPAGQAIRPTAEIWRKKPCQPSVENA